MIEIKHKDTKEILLVIETDTLENAYLMQNNLAGADFSNQSLSGAFLTGADLTGANLAGADLRGVDFTFANLTEANLEGAELEGASLYNAIAVNTDFSNANLMYANFALTTLTGSDLTCAILGFTQFTLCDTLHETHGLDEINHVEATSLDAHTLKRSIKHLSNTFLMGCSYSPEEIKEMRIHYGSFHTCFLSYARLDREFADSFYNDLKEANVLCWRDEIDTRSGPNWQEQINEALRTKEKVLLLCSQTSLSSRYVIEEIINTLHLEREKGISKLVPIDLDGYLFETEIAVVAADMLASGKYDIDWISEIRKHQVAYFREWKDQSTYRKQFEKLLRDLKRLEGASD